MRWVLLAALIPCLGFVGTYDSAGKPADRFACTERVYMVTDAQGALLIEWIAPDGSIAERHDTHTMGQHLAAWLQIESAYDPMGADSGLSHYAGGWRVRVHSDRGVESSPFELLC